MERPITVEEAQRDQDDLARLIGYQIYSARIPASQSILLSDGTANFMVNSKKLQINKGKSSFQNWPVLCTQSDTQTTTKASVATTSNIFNVTTAQSRNTFTGYRNKKSFRFLGIPYSNVPARWTYGKVNTRTKSYFNATSFGSICPQSGSQVDDENCLFLNIWTNYLPSGSNDNLRPVLFWIHGGAFTGGSGSDPTFDGGNLVSRGDVILVTINYRLANLGFLNVPGTNITGNYGIADQILALKWVRNNIKAFGGDPDRITIWGQSAGAGSVRALLGSPESRNLFAAAIPGSNLGGYDYGTSYSQYYTPQESYAVIGNATIFAAGCSGNNSSTIQCLQRVSAYDLQNTVPNKSPANGNSARFVIVDGTYITESRLNVTDRRKVANVPTLWGNVAEDAAPFLQYSSSGTNRTTAISSVLYGDQASFAKDVLANENLFPLGTSLSNNISLNAFNLSAQVGTDVIFRCLDQATVSSALKHKSFQKSWYYQFERTYQPSGFDPNAPVCDAPKTANRPNGDPSLPYLRCHSGDLLFEFGNYANEAVVFRDQYDLPFTALIMDYWTAFARDHDPNPPTDYLSVRGYSSTAEITQKTGRWQESQSQNLNARLLDALPRQLFTSIRSKQCSIVGIPSEYLEPSSIAT
ncbi:alpha/beta-hydrolase [Meira miltonrushii]|uniref:Carboxylic ester hydrolase n=1 Tax=Meira miltonrushii TaxID=1280837 RepID=A0A316VK89_9BASI|nr:alpha/beta-hydrolase [Meira miltonrushii]PWN36441.1 alpha/beta-hydrolase [Meira miltonrushii]